MFYNIKGHWKTTLGQERFQKAKIARLARHGQEMKYLKKIFFVQCSNSLKKGI